MDYGHYAPIIGSRIFATGPGTAHNLRGALMVVNIGIIGIILGIYILIPDSGTFGTFPAHLQL